MNKLLFCLCTLFLLHCTEVPDYSTLKVSASPTNGGSIRKSPSGPEYEDGTVVTLIAEAAPGYAFAGWSGNVSMTDATKTTVVVKGNNMVIANFVIMPKTPYDVTARDRSNNIFIEWPSVSNATGYSIYRSTSPSGNYIQIGTSMTTSYADYDIQLGTTYYYKVSAYNGSVEGSQSGYTQVATQLGTPASVRATTSSAGSVNIEWAPVQGATLYRIYRGTSSSGSYTSVGTSTTPSYTDTGVSSGTTYYYKVTAQSSNGVEGPKSEYAFATTRLSPPTGVSARFNEEDGGITVSWSPVSSATVYYIYRNTASSGNYTQIGTSPTTSYDDNECEPEATYYYKVKAYNNSGNESAQSSSTSAVVCKW